MQFLRPVRNRLHLYFAAAFLFVAPLTVTAWTQQAAPQSKSAEFDVFGGYQSVQPDYNSGYGNQRVNGYFAGFNYSYFGFHKLPVVPGLELRGGDAKGSNVNEGYGLAGPRVQATFLRRIHPYANVLFGFGDIYFDKVVVPGYLHDSAIVYSVGGGVDFDLKYHLQAKVDYQYQFWNTGNDPFTPDIFGAGLSYRFPIRSH